MNYFKFFSIMAVAAILLGLPSCKEGDTDTRELTGTWNTMNKDDYNIEVEGGGSVGSLIINMLKNSGVKFMPPTIVFNEDFSGSFVYSDKTTTEFKYIKLGNTITITATGMKVDKKKLPLVVIPTTYSINSANELHLVINALEITKAYITALGSPYNTYADKITKAEISCWYKK